LQHIQLNWRAIRLTTLDNGQAQAQMIVQRYPDVFMEKLGIM